MRQSCKEQEAERFYFKKKKKNWQEVDGEKDQSIFKGRRKGVPLSETFSAPIIRPANPK